MKRALTIAGSDSGGGAGIQADLKTFAAHGVYGMTAITAITAQNTLGVSAVHALPADLVTAQIEAVTSDIGVDAAKTGMLANAAIVEAVAAAVETLEIPFLVVDPVMVAKGGSKLLEDDAIGTLKTELLRRAYVVTPNRMEAELLSGLRIESLDDARRAAERIHELGASAVIIKGGHMDMAQAVDLLFDGRSFTELRAERIQTSATHGTGCTFAAALTANLALGRPLVLAAQLAKKYVTLAIRHGLAIGRGHNPLDHFWAFRAGSSQE